MTSLRNWTVHLVRRDGLESHSLDLGRRRVVLIGVVAILAFVGLGGVGGLWWASRQESATISGMRDEIERLRAEGAQVGELAARLVEVEDRFAVLRAAVTEGQPEAAPPANIVVGQSPGLVARPEVEETTLAWPLAQRGFVTRTFGSRAETAREGHTGLDIAIPTGSYVRAIQGGRVEAAGQDSVYGRFLRIAHADGLTSLYGHNSWLFVAAGDEVERLQVIALSGNTGRSSAPHLHLELSRNGSLVDPLSLVADETARGAAPTRAAPEQR